MLDTLIIYAAVDKAAASTKPAIFVIKKASGKTLTAGTWVIEKLNLKTDHNLKGDISGMSDAKLLANQSAARRSLSSSITGVVASTVLTAATPVFAAGIIINSLQATVSSINRHRVKREIKVRLQKDPKFKAMFDANNHPSHDIVFGITIKLAFITASAGIVGFDHIIDNFTNLTHHAALQAAGALACNTSVTASSGQIGVQHFDISNLKMPGHSLVNHATDRAAQFQAKHLKMALADNGIHKAFAGMADKITAAMGKVSGFQIGDETGWGSLLEMMNAGAKTGELFGQTLFVGAVGELVQPLVQVTDIMSDKYLTWRVESRAVRAVRAGRADREEGGLKANVKRFRDKVSRKK